MSLPERLSSLSSASDQRGTGGSDSRRDSDLSDSAPPFVSNVGLVQRCVIIQKDERGYGLTVSGDNPVYVASVKPEGAAAKAGVQKHDRIVKVNGTLVTSKNHTDVVRLIKSGAYVALTLMGKPNSATSPGGNQPPPSPFLPDSSTAPSNRNSRITAPQPVAPDKDRELLLQKVHMTQAMYEQAKEDFQKHQRQYVKTPSERLHTQLLEKERTVKTLENQLRQLTGSEEPSTPGSSQGSQRFSDIEQSNTDSLSLNSLLHPASLPPLPHPPSIQQQRGSSGETKHIKQASVPVSFYHSESCESGRLAPSVMRSKSDAASRRQLRTGGSQSTFFVSSDGGVGADKASEATSLPVSDLGSMSDSPHTSPSISPTPVHPDNRPDDDNSVSSRTDSAIEDCMPMQPEIITIDDEDVNSDDDQAMDTGPFSDIRLLERKPAHMALFLNYLISNSDPSPFFFYIVTDAYKQTAGSTKELRKWGYEIFSTFLAHHAPLRVEVSESLLSQVNDILVAGTTRGDNESILRSMFDGARAALIVELNDQLADFRNKKDLGLGNIFGVHELKENMDKTSELKVIEKYLMPHLSRCVSTQDETGCKLSDRDQAVGWALATFFRQVGISKTSSSSVMERVQSFIMKDKRGFKMPGSRSAKTKTVKSHQFNLQHFYVPTLCSKCEGLIWGVGYQGFLCQSCEMGVHKQCVEDVVETCSGKKRGKRASAFIPVLSSSRKVSNPNQQAGERFYSVSEALSQALSGEAKSPPYTTTDAPGGGLPQPLRKEDEADIAGLPTEHSVRSIVSRYQELASPTGPGPGDTDTADTESRKGSVDLNRSESLKGKGDKAERPARRAKSDVDRDDMFRALNQQSGSSSASSLSNRSVESPSASSEFVSDALAAARAPQYDSDLEVEELPPLKEVLGDDVLKKLKPKEKKRQEVINELFHTEKAHLRNLKVLELLFYQPMVSEVGGVMSELARALFPNIEEIIKLHASMNKTMKDRRSHNPVVGDVGDILLQRFGGEQGDDFRKACAEYCRNQSFALEALKRHRRKDQQLAQFLAETEADKLCRKLELKDHVPCQMQRLTKYPMLIENLLKYTQSPISQEYRNLEQALERSKHILAYVNTAVRECENYHKLKEMQKRLDKRAIDASADPSLVDIKKLDLTQHKLVYDGPLVWRLRSHRLIELQVLLLEDILVLLQRVDERLVLKCQSTNQQAIGNDYKYTHSPVLKLQNLLARNVATDKKAFFVINTSDTGPQIYELVAQTQDARKTWCKLINEMAEGCKKSLGSLKMTHIQKSTPSPEPDEMTLVRSRIMRKSQEPSPPPADMGQAAAPSDQDTTDGIASLATADYQPELIQPDQVSVSGAVTAQALPVLSPLERLRRTDQVICQAMSEKEQIVAEMLHMSLSEHQHLAQQRNRNCSWDEGESDEQLLVVSCMQTNNRLLQLIAHRASSLTSDPQLQGPDPDNGSRSGFLASSSVASDSGPSQLRQQQEQLAQGAAGQNISIPVPMDQLRGMANEMNSILSNLLSVMGTKGEERKSLRTELQAAQDQLEMLKAIQRQMITQQSPSPSTPQSRPLSFVSVASSISESGEATDSDRQDEECGTMLKVAQTRELTPEMMEATEETVQQLMTEVQPQVVTTNPDDDSDDGYEMVVENLPLPDDNSVRAAETFTSSQATSDREESSSEPMITDLDEGGGEEEGRSTPTPSVTSTSTLMSTVIEDEGWEGDNVTTACPSKQQAVGRMDRGGPKGEDEESANNNNNSSQDSELTNPIEV